MIMWWSDICSGDNCSFDDFSDNKELETNEGDDWVFGSGEGED